MRTRLYAICTERQTSAGVRVDHVGLRLWATSPDIAVANAKRLVTTFHPLVAIPVES